MRDKIIEHLSRTDLHWTERMSPHGIADSMREPDWRRVGFAVMDLADEAAIKQDKQGGWHVADQQQTEGRESGEGYGEAVIYHARAELPPYSAADG